MTDPEFAKLVAEHARLAQQMSPPPEQFARLNEKSTELAQAIQRGDHDAQRRYERELAELAAHLRPAPEALHRLREVSRQLGRHGRQLAHLHGLHPGHQRHAIHDQVREAIERAHEEAAGHSFGPDPETMGGAPAQARLAADRARLEQDLHRLEQDRARLTAELQRLNAESKRREHELRRDQAAEKE